MDQQEDIYKLKYKYIRWDFWIAQYDIGIYEAILLSLGFDPESTYYPDRIWATSFKSDDRILLDERVNCVKSHIGKGKTFDTDIEGDILNYRISLRKFAKFSVKKLTPIPDEFIQIAQNKPLIEPQNLDNNLSIESINNTEESKINHANFSHDQQHNQLLAENEQLRARIVELEVQKLKEDEIIPNSHLLLIAALKIVLQNEIKVKSNKSQAKILQKIEDENKDRSGLSVSNTSKILPKANKAYKALNNLQIK